MNELITTTRKDSKAIVAKLSPAARVECDKVFAMTDTVSAAATAIESAQRSFEPQLCDSFSKIAADKDGLKAAGYDKFPDFAKAVFGMDDKLASMYKRVGDKFYNVEKRPTVAGWYTASKLQELRNVPLDKLDTDAASGVLTPDMTLKQLRTYAAKPALESGDTELVKTYDGGYMESGETFSMLDENGIAAALNGNVTPDENRIHIFKSADKFIIKAATDKGKDKERPCYIMVVESENGRLYAAKYHEHVNTTATKKQPYSGKEDAIRKAREQGLTDEQIKAIFG